MKRILRLTIVLCVILAAQACVMINQCLADTASDMQAAKEMFDAKNYDGAIQILSGIASTDPEAAPEALQLMGRCYQRKKDYTKAIENYELAVSKASTPRDDATIKVARERIAGCYWELKNYDQALAAYGELLRSYPSDAPEYYWGIANCYKEQHKSAEEMTALEKGIQHDSASNYVHTLQLMRVEHAGCQVRLKEWDKVRQECQALMADYPNSVSQATWRFLIGLSYKEQENCQSAKPIFRGVIAKYPKDPSAGDASLHLAICLAQEGNPDEAVAVLDKHLTERPTDRAKVLFWKATVLGLYSKPILCDRAMPIVNQFISEYPDDQYAADGSFLLAKCLARQGNSDEALAALDKYVAKHPEDEVKISLWKGEVLAIHAREYDRAIVLLRKFIADYPNDPLVSQAKTILNFALEKTGQLDGDTSVPK